MPEISRFYGIVVKMYFSKSEHGIPHFHAIYGEYVGVFSINPLEMIEGDLPNTALKLVKEWGTLYQEEILKIWNEQIFKKLPGLN